MDLTFILSAILNAPTIPSETERIFFKYQDYAFTLTSLLFLISHLSLRLSLEAYLAKQKTKWSDIDLTLG